jgi:hypothetical protein
VNGFRIALNELWGLFVEDATLTIGALGCVAAAAFVVPRAGIPMRWRAPLFFVLVALVLLENVRRSARR